MAGLLVHIARCFAFSRHDGMNSLYGYLISN
jgi:hypothetical protein